MDGLTTPPPRPKKPKCISTGISLKAQKFPKEGRKLFVSKGNWSLALIAYNLLSQGYQLEHIGSRCAPGF
ncbi:MAG: hypothetical protein R2865_03815 [Deinococcales bacterium]